MEGSKESSNQRNINIYSKSFIFKVYLSISFLFSLVVVGIMLSTYFVDIFMSFNKWSVSIISILVAFIFFLLSFKGVFNYIYLSLFSFSLGFLIIPILVHYLHFFSIFYFEMVFVSLAVMCLIFAIYTFLLNGFSYLVFIFLSTPIISLVWIFRDYIGFSKLDSFLFSLGVIFFAFFISGIVSDNSEESSYNDNNESGDKNSSSTNIDDFEEEMGISSYSLMVLTISFIYVIVLSALAIVLKFIIFLFIKVFGILKSILAFLWENIIFVILFLIFLLFGGGGDSSSSSSYDYYSSRSEAGGGDSCGDGCGDGGGDGE